MIVGGEAECATKIMDSYKGECYPEGLSLEGEPGRGENNFLETVIVNLDIDVQCKHRNENGLGVEPTALFEGEACGQLSLRQTQVWGADWNHDKNCQKLLKG